MLICSSLVMLMTPGLALFYGGFVQRENTLAVMMQSFFSLAWTSVLWFAFGYSMCFGPTLYGVVGNPFTHAFLRGFALNSLYQNDSALGIPTLVHVVYQMTFAVITPALITGAFVNRVTFRSYVWFLTGWLIFVYFPFCHMVWSPEGILAKIGVLDYAGGIVVHITAGFAAVASVLYVGRRRNIISTPHNIPMVALGTGLIWFGWFGFNSGSEFKVDAVTTSAFFNTTIAASFGAIAWLTIEWIYSTRPKFTGLLIGSIAGMATVTPAAGYVSPIAAAAIGLVAGATCFAAVALKNRIGLDDALDVWGVHGMGGFVGIILLGLLADKAWNPSLATDGLLMGGSPIFFGVQLAAAVASAIWAFCATYGMLWIIDHMVTPVRVEGSIEDEGLDMELGEVAYMD